MGQIREGLPHPRMADGVNPSAPERVETVQESLERMRRNRAVDAELAHIEAQTDNLRRRGVDSSAPPAEPALKLNLDLGDIVKQSMDTARSMSDKVTDMMTGQTRAEILAVNTKLEEALAKLEGGKSDVAVYREVKGVLDELAKGMQGSLALPVTAGGGGDLPLLLQMKRLDVDMQERRLQWDKEQVLGTRRWDEDREERRRRWEVEDRQWIATFNQKKQEYEDGHRTRERAMGNMGDLVKAVTEGVDAEMAGGAPAAAASAPPAVRAIRVNGYKCEACQAPLQWDGKPQSEAVCSREECGARYAMEPSA